MKDITKDPVYQDALREYYSYEFSPFSWWMRNVIMPGFLIVAVVLLVVGLYIRL